MDFSQNLDFLIFRILIYQFFIKSGFKQVTHDLEKNSHKKFLLLETGRFKELSYFLFQSLPVNSDPVVAPNCHSLTTGTAAHDSELFLCGIPKIVELLSH